MTHNCLSRFEFELFWKAHLCFNYLFLIDGKNLFDCQAVDKKMTVKNLQNLIFIETLKSNGFEAVT